MQHRFCSAYITTRLCVYAWAINTFAMKHFDLISDLHLDRWPSNHKSWKGLCTSQTCVVAGDVSSNPRLSTSFIKHLADCYEHVLFIDGNHEHKARPFNIERNEQFIEDQLSKLDNVTYLADAVTTIDGVAFVGSNGWWTYDYQELFGGGSRLECIEQFCADENLELADAMNIWQTAQEQVDYMAKVISIMQEDDDIDEIVVVTHTVPRPDLFYMDGSLVDYGKMGNSSYQTVIDADYENKISTWVFGHYHSVHVDVEMNSIRYVSNPRGTPETSLSPVYHPLIVRLSE